MGVIKPLEASMEVVDSDPRLTLLLGRMEALAGQVDRLVEHQRKQQELLDELLLPVAKEVMSTATLRLDDLEKKGYFAFVREVAKVGARVVESYSPEDVRQLGEAVTSILDTVRALTRPEVLTVASEVSGVLARADTTEPLGLVGMVRATRDDDVQRGMAVAMELLKRVGKGAGKLAEKHDRQSASQEKLAAMLAPRHKALGIERPKARQEPPAPACAVPSAPRPVAVVIDGISFSADGHLADPSQWTKTLAETLAASQGVTLTPAHWSLIDLARHDFTEVKVAPNIRRLTQLAGVSTKEVYALFPKAPGRTIAKIAGLPKPAGCL